MPSGLVRTQWFYHDRDNEKWPKESEVDKEGTRWFRIGPIAVEHPDEIKLVYDQQKDMGSHAVLASHPIPQRKAYHGAGQRARQNARHALAIGRGLSRLHGDVRLLDDVYPFSRF